MNRHLLLATLALALTGLAAQAVPALRRPFTVVQPDGTELVLRQVGDENMHFLLTDDNKLVIQDADGQYSYARVQPDGSISSTGIRSLDSRVRPASHNMLTQSFESLDLQAIRKARLERAPLRTLQAAAGPSASRAKAASSSDSKYSGLGRFTTTYPNKGEIRGLIILVEYTDVSFSTTAYPKDAHDYFTRLVQEQGFSDLGGTGSARDYFIEQSMGQFRPRFDVYGPVKLPNNRKYYGGNDRYGDDSKPEWMVTDAVKILDPDVDFSVYDNNNDGIIDNVFVFFAGHGEATSNIADAVWPHSYSLISGGASVTCDGKKFDSYACSNELFGNQPDGIGTFVHEFSHVMGLPDLYCTDYSDAESLTPGSYSVLDMGPYNNNSRTPPAYSAYERNAMGWLNPIVLDSRPESLSFSHILESNTAALIPTSKDNEFFLLENRQLKGWDKYIPGHGMLIWHVDYNENIFDRNRVNNNPSHQYVDVIERNGNPNNNSPTALAGYTWPGTGNNAKTAFNASTSPALLDWNGKPTVCSISEIAEIDGVIYFDNNGGSHLDIPVGNEVTDKSDKHFTATWTPVDGATDYYVTVKGIVSYGELMDETADMGSEKTFSLPAGWESSTTDYYSTYGNYGAASPSHKLGNDGAFITTGVFPGDIKGIKLWMKGQNTQNSGSNLTIFSVSGSDNKLLATIAPSGQGATYTVAPEDIPSGVHQLKFVYNKISGNLAIDDIVITSGGESHVILDGYDNKSTGGATTLRVEGQVAGAARHYFTVRSTDGKYTSQASDPVYVELPSGVEDIVDAVAETTVLINGRTLTVSTSAGRVQIYDAMGREVIDTRVSDGSVTLTLPSAGMYIVRAGGTTAKVAAR